MKRSALGTLCGIFSAFLLVAQARAESTLTGEVLRDCPKALRRLETLPNDQIEDAVMRLVRVLRLDVASNEVVQPNVEGAVTPPFPLAQSQGSELWRTFEPFSEFEGKRCAVEGLRLLSSHAARAVPELASLAADPATPEDLAAQARATVTHIIMRVGVDNFSAEDIARIVEVIAKDSGDFPENVALSFGALIVPHMFAAFETADEREQDILLALLMKLPVSPFLYESDFARLLRAPSQDIRARSAFLLGHLGSLPYALWSTLLGLTLDESQEVREIALHTILTSDTTLRYLPLSDTAENTLIESLRLKRDTRSGAERLLLANAARMTAPSSSLLLLLAESDPELRAAGLRILSMITASATVFQIIVTALQDPDPIVQYHALRSLRFQHERKALVISALKKYLSFARSRKTQDEFVELLGETALLIRYLEASKESLALAPLFAEGLVGAKELTKDDEGTQALEELLIKLGPIAYDALAKASVNASPPARERIREVMGRIPSAVGKPTESERARLRSFVRR